MYWDQAGKNNTVSTVKLAIDRAKELGIKHLVVASNTGESAVLGLDSGLEVVCVTHHVGFAGPGVDEMPDETRQKLVQAGAKVLTTTHLMAGLDRCLRIKFGGLYPSEIIAMSLRLLGQGMKVCVEVSVMALDAGLIPYGEDVVAVAGSTQGADTAVVIRPEHSNNFFDTKIKEIICKPREF